MILDKDSHDYLSSVCYIRRHHELTDGKNSNFLYESGDQLQPYDVFYKTVKDDVFDFVVHQRNKDA